MANPVLVDNQFWLQVMGDHAIMIYENLAPLETTEITKAQDFIVLYNKLLAEARKDIPDDQVTEVIAQALKATQDFRDFKLHILTRQLTDIIRLNLSTGLINHFIYEDDEYIFMLERYKSNTVPKFNPIHYDIFWLRDGMDHAIILESFLNFPYREIFNEAEAFIPKLQLLYNKAIEFGDYLRTGIKDFPAIHQLNEDAYEIDRLFAEFIVDLEQKITNKKVVIPITLLLLDHMYREECYYLTQLASVTNKNPPVCDPAAPRKLIQA